MTQAELGLIEQGWDALVERLGLAEATRFVMLLDRRTGSALQHLQHLWAGHNPGPATRGTDARLRLPPLES
ncbi:MAG: hypothetical protein MUD01_15175 [Chloroflexaceae bacterium]|jgi:hypothetical protein|nr:hypothetical protein [Chloroflexaceae bacterium]